LDFLQFLFKIIIFASSEVGIPTPNAGHFSTNHHRNLNFSLGESCIRAGGIISLPCRIPKKWESNLKQLFPLQIEPRKPQESPGISSRSWLFALSGGTKPIVFLVVFIGLRRCAIAMEFLSKSY